jgi:F0F1-type ATP synthase assembly protein I
MAEEPKHKGAQSTGESVGEAYAKAGPYLDASWQLSGSLVIWVLLGWFLDTRLGTKPWLLVAGSFVGLGLGFYLFFRTLMRIGKGKAGK